MKRRVSLMAIMLGSFLFSAALALAEVRFNVPFDFTVGKVTSPCGVLQREQSGYYSDPFVSLKNSDGNEGAFEQINSVQLNPGQMSDATKLIFHRYGDQYFLAEFWNLGSKTGYEFRRSKAEREIARNLAQPKTEILPAGQ